MLAYLGTLLKAPFSFATDYAGPNIQKQSGIMHAGSFHADEQQPVVRTLINQYETQRLR